MKKVASSSGFTIVELMIVLAVTGILFAAMAGSWSTRQRNNEFLTAMQDGRQRMQQTLSEVDNGFFPDTGSFSCKGGGSLTFGSGTPGQGSQGGCIFMGKTMTFSSSSQVATKFVIAGLASAQNVTAATPTLAPDLTETVQLPSDLSYVSTTVNGSSDYLGVAFISDVGDYSAPQGKLKSGRQSIGIYGLKNALPMTGGTPLGGNYVKANSAGVRVCFKSSKTSKFALITIGANGSATDVQAVAANSCGAAV